MLGYQDAEPEVRQHLAALLFEAWYRPLYRHGVLHADPHPGNYSVTDDLRLNLMDFGCVRTFEPQVVQGVVDLYRALLQDDRAAARQAFALWGFTTMTEPLLDVLLLWARFLYGPLLVDRPVDLATEFPSREGQRLAGEILRQLKDLGGVTPPRAFVFLDRAAVGIGSMLLRLRACLNWHQLFEGLIEPPFHAQIPPSPPGPR